MSSSVGGCAKCIKYMLFILNFVFWICGITMVGVGIWILMSFPSYIEVLDNAFLNSAVYLLIGAGGVVTVVAFLGCCGAVMENKGLLTGYSVLITLMFLCEIGVAGLVFYFGTTDVIAHVTEAANETFVEYGNHKVITNSWDTVQHLGQCCGINGYNDYDYTAWGKMFPNEGQIPDSCCAVEDLKTGEYRNLTICHELENEDYFNSKGCYETLKDFVDSNFYIVAGVAVGIAALQLIGIIGGYWLCCAISRD